MNIILQHFDGELRELDKLSIENIQKYAEFVGAEYQLVRGKPFNKTLTAPCQKVHMLSEDYDVYDQVLMLDIDMFRPRNMYTNIFDVKGIGMYADTQKRLHRSLVSLYKSHSSMDKPYWGGAIYKMNLETRKKLRSGFNGNIDWIQNYNKPYHFEDEGIMHSLAVKSNIDISENEKYLDQKWCWCSFLPEPERAGFIHVRTKVTPQGPKREKIENYYDLAMRGIL